MPKRVTTKAVNGEVRKLPMRRASKYPWDRIKEMYIESLEPVNLKELSEMFDTPYQAVRERSSEERWPYERAEFQSQANAKKARDKIKLLAREAEAFDEGSLKPAKLGQQLIAGRLSQIAQIFAASQQAHNAAVARLQAGQPVTREDLYSPINYKELGELAAALLRFQEVGRKALGTDVQNVNLTASTEGELNVSVNLELQRDDPDRQAALLEVLERTGLIPKMAIGNAVDGEVIGDEEVENDEEHEDDEEG